VTHGIRTLTTSAESAPATRWVRQIAITERRHGAPKVTADTITRLGFTRLNDRRSIANGLLLYTRLDTPWRRPTLARPFSPSLHKDTKGVASWVSVDVQRFVGIGSPVEQQLGSQR